MMPIKEFIEVFTQGKNFLIYSTVGLVLRFSIVKPKGFRDIFWTVVSSLSMAFVTATLAESIGFISEKAFWPVYAVVTALGMWFLPYMQNGLVSYWNAKTGVAKTSEGQSNE
jgi:hypothetical protein